MSGDPVFDSESDRDPFDLIKGNLIACTVVDLRRSRAFVRGHGSYCAEMAIRVTISAAKDSTPRRKKYLTKEEYEFRVR
jgi:hypothetical protein